MATLIDVIVDDNGKVITLNNQPLCFMLPDTYHKVDYIASTGTQYIDTNIIPTSDDLIYEWEGRDDTYSGYTSLFSCEYAVGGDYNNRDFGGVLHGNYNNRPIYLGKTTGMSIGYNSTDGKFHKWSLVINSNHKVYLVKDGTKLTEYSWTGSIDRYNSIALFCNHTTNSFSQNASVAYRYFRIKNKEKLVFYGIPAKRNSDSVLGMYDLITKQFFINAGTGTFVADPDANVSSNNITITVNVTGSYWGTGSSISIGGQIASNITQGSTYTFDIPADTSYTLSVNNTNSRLTKILDVNNTVVGIDTGQNPSYTFTPTTNMTFRTTAYIDKV